VQETFAEYPARVLGYLGSWDPVRVQRATPAALERRLRRARRTVLNRRPTPSKWSITEIVAHMAGRAACWSRRIVEPRYER
jgi:hypothetical protein